jgi:RNA polymerase sigma-70 factor (ECF subfamily)
LLETGQEKSEMSSPASIVDLMVRLRDGEDAAAREVFARFTARLLGLARNHLGGLLARKVDPEDVVQSAYKSFFIRQRDAGLDIQSWDGLWGLLTMITLRKCADRAEHYGAQKRDLNREDGGDAAWQSAVDRDPSPEEAVVLSETLHGLFASIGDADERTILELSLQGYTATEISETTGRAERSVRRLREKIRKSLERESSVDGLAP